jgi:magnesium transporter
MSDTEDRGIAVLIDAALRTEPEEVAKELDRASLDEAAALVRRYAGLPGWIPAIMALSSERAAQLFEVLPAEAGVPLLEAMGPSTAAVILSRVEATSRERFLSASSSGFVREIRELLSYPESTAGRMMDPRVMAFRKSVRVDEVLGRLRTASWKRLFEILVVASDGQLEGSVPLQAVAVAAPEETLGNLMTPVTSFVRATATREEVVEMLEVKKLPVLPVVDFAGKLLGAIRYDALITAASEEVSVDIQTMVGASREERALSKVSFAVRKRLPWLQINLGTAFLAASVVGLFESTIARFTALAVLLPVVAGQSGNTGAQALAVVMRGLALREIRTRQWLHVLSKEVRVGALNGIAVAATTSFFVFLWSRSIGLALVIGLSMVLSMAIAGLSGGAIPLLLTSIGQDPAQSSSIILTTVTDVVGFFSFLGIATLLASML